MNPGISKPRNGTHPGRRRAPRACTITASLVGGLLGSVPSGGEASSRPAHREQEWRGAERVLIDHRLERRVVRVLSVDRGTLSYLDRGELVRTEPLSEYLAVLTPDPSPNDAEWRKGAGAWDRGVPGPAGETPMIVLTDGQRYAGAVRRSVDATGLMEVIPWEHPVLGPMDVPLDRVAAVRLGQRETGPDGLIGVEAEPPAGRDLIVMVNGDRLVGLVAGVLPGGSGVRLAGDDSAERDLPLDRIARIGLGSNAGLRPRPGAPQAPIVVWLSDGSVVACERLASAGRRGEVLMEPWPPARRLQQPVTMSDIAGLDLSGGRLVALASATVQRQAPIGRRWSERVHVGGPVGELGLGDVRLPGPMQVEWLLPGRGERFAAVIELPATLWTWGDCEVAVLTRPGSSKPTGAIGEAAMSSVDAGWNERWRGRVHGDAPQATVNVALEGAEILAVRVEPGLYGPVQDRIVLRRPMVLIEPASR